MMWSILKIYIAIGLLVASVYGTHFETIIKDAIERRELIDGIFRPISDTKIHTTGSIFKGVNMADNRDVAMKFSSNMSLSETEYEMYSYLAAINNPEIEKYGILPILYYNECNDHTLTVFPLYECSLWKQRYELNVQFQIIDYLILFRDFVRQSKYIHSHGVRYDDLRPENIMLRKGRSFLFDFGICSKMYESKRIGSMDYASRRFHKYVTYPESLQKNYIPEPIDDWECFLYVMAYVARVDLSWYNSMQQYKYHPLVYVSEKVGSLKENTQGTINQIKNDVKCPQLKELLLKFAEEVFDSGDFIPRYDDFEKYITQKIEDVIGKDEPAVFSWLKGDERIEAINDLKNNPPATTQIIANPKDTYLPTDYKTPVYDFFKDLKRDMAKQADKNHQIEIEAANKKKKKEKKKGVLSKLIPRKHH